MNCSNGSVGVPLPVAGLCLLPYLSSVHRAKRRTCFVRLFVLKDAHKSGSRRPQPNSSPVYSSGRGRASSIGQAMIVRSHRRDSVRESVSGCIPDD
jgi:hypothetical protein